MSELTDDQLDGLFRKSAEEFDPPFDSAAWQDMKARLDANDRTVPTSGASQVKNILRWGLPVVLLLLLVGWFVYQPDKSAGLVSVPSAERNPDTTKATTGGDGRSLAAEQPNKEDAPVKPTRTPEEAVPSSRPIAGLENGKPDGSPLESHTDAVPSRSIKTGVTEKVTPVKSSKDKESVSVAVGEKKWVFRSPLDKLPTDKPRLMAANGQPTASRSGRRKNLTSSSNALDGKPRKNTAYTRADRYPQVIGMD